MKVTSSFVAAGTRVDPVPIWDPRFRKAVQKTVGGEPPAWMQIFPYPKYVGTIDGEKTTFVTDDESQNSIVEFFAARGNALVIDYEHQTDLTDSGIKAPAAGRIVELVAGGKKGLLARCEWTEEGADDLKTGRYFYDSPTFLYGEEDLRIYILRSLALTNSPGSWNRMYVTDNSNIDYGIKKAAASAKGRAMKMLCAKGGRTMELGSFLESLRYTLGRPVTVTGNEMRADLQKIMDLIPASDDMIFLTEDNNATKQKDQTIADLLGDAKLAAAAQKSTDATTSDDATKIAEATTAAATAALAPVLVALDMKDGDGKAAALAILGLKATTVPATRVRELEAELEAASAKTDEDRLELLISSNKAKLTPHVEAEVRRVAKQSFDLAKTFVDALPPLDLGSQSEKTEPKKPDVPAVEVSPDPLIAASQKAEKRTRQIMAEKNLDYAAASKLRLDEEMAAAK